MGEPVGLKSAIKLPFLSRQNHPSYSTTFLRAMSEKYSQTEDILRLFYKTSTVKVGKLEPAMWSVGPIVDTETGEIIVKAGAQIGDSLSLIQNGRIGLNDQRPKKMDKGEAEKYPKIGEETLYNNKRMYVAKNNYLTNRIELRDENGVLTIISFDDYLDQKILLL